MAFSSADSPFLGGTMGGEMTCFSGVSHCRGDEGMEAKQKKEQNKKILRFTIVTCTAWRTLR